MTLKLGRNEFKKTSRKKQCRFPFRFRNKIYSDCIRARDHGITLQVTDIEYVNETGNYEQGNVTSFNSYICATGSELLADEIFDYGWVSKQNKHFGREADCGRSAKPWYDEFKVPKVCYEQTKAWHSWLLEFFHKNSKRKKYVNR